MHTPSTVALRATSPTDLATLRTLVDDPAFAGWGGEVPLSDDDLRTKYLGARLPDVECFLVLRGDAPEDLDPVGLALLHVADEGEGGGLDLILLPRARGAGAGRTVVEALVERAQAVHRWARLTVDPDVGNPAGIRFWEAVGFVRLRRVEDAPGREPYLLMERRIA